MQYVFDQGEGEGHIDWQDVQNRSDAAAEGAKDLQLQAYANGLVKTSDRNFGYIANRVLESGYKAVLASHRIEYPVSGRDGQDLGWLVELIRERIGSPAPGEDYSYLTEFAGSGVAVREQRLLDESPLAQAIPTAVREIISRKANAANETV